MYVNVPFWDTIPRAVNYSDLFTNNIEIICEIFMSLWFMYDLFEFDIYIIYLYIAFFCCMQIFPNIWSI